MPTAEALLKQARTLLSHVHTPALDARLLLQHVSGLSHADLVAEPQAMMTEEVALLFRALVQRRVLHEPVSRIIGMREFYGRDFEVTPDVLDPRADTEVLIDTSLGLLPADKPLRILDLGTGSGIVAVTVLAERPLATAIAVDVSSRALAVAGRNAAACGVQQRLELRNTSWFEDISERFDAILSNPPYIKAAVVAMLARDVKDYDPHLALVGGEDGLDCYRAIAADAASHLVAGGFVAVEIGEGQDADVTGIFAQQGLQWLASHSDLGGRIRCLVFREAVGKL